MITHVWGRADKFDLIFLNIMGDIWNASVPADLDDGQYVVELYCEDDSGNMAYWTGILYLSNSENAKIQIIADKNKLWLIGDIKLKLLNESLLWLEDDKITIKTSNKEHLGGW